MSVTVRVTGKPGHDTPDSIPAETVAEFEEGFTTCKDRNALLMVTGTDAERTEYIHNAKVWARNRDKRLTVRLYPHPNPEPNSTYYRIIPFVRGND